MSDFKQLLSTNLDTLNNQQLFSLIEGLENSILIKKHNGKYDADLNTQVKLLKNHLQEACKFYLINRFGNSDIIIKMNLLFPSYINGNANEHIIIHCAPIDYVPYCVFYFIRLVDNWKFGLFHRNAGHVKQVKVEGDFKPLVFQEYHKAFPHVEYTLGYAGRPGGPGFYISTRDNTINHGPGSQKSTTGEADGCFGIVYDESSKLVIERLKKMQGMNGNAGFITNKDNCVKILNYEFI
jgi:hypothetical protein